MRPISWLAIIWRGTLQRGPRPVLIIGRRRFLISDGLARRIGWKNGASALTTGLLSLAYTWAASTGLLPPIGPGAAEWIAQVLLMILVIVLVHLISGLLLIPRDAEDQMTEITRGQADASDRLSL